MAGLSGNLLGLGAIIYSRQSDWNPGPRSYCITLDLFPHSEQQILGKQKEDSVAKGKFKGTFIINGTNKKEQDLKLFFIQFQFSGRQPKHDSLGSQIAYRNEVSWRKAWGSVHEEDVYKSHFVLVRDIKPLECVSWETLGCPRHACEKVRLQTQAHRAIKAMKAKPAATQPHLARGFPGPANSWGRISRKVT